MTKKQISQEEQLEQVVPLSLSDLYPFPNHAYGIRDDASMQETMESVAQSGVVVPAIVRPRAEGGYEIVSGHRRKLACEKAGLTEMPCIIRNLDDDEAVIQLVNSNAQREDVLPSERAKAYKMRLEAVKRVAGRRKNSEKINSPNNSANFRSDDLLRQAGYEIKGTVNPSLKGGTQKRFLRMDTLDDGYTPEALRDVLAGKQAHTPRQRKQKTTAPSQRKNQLLIDIEQKLAQGNGAGYAKWAKRFNLKQMAQTVAYLQEHGLMDYAVLSEKAAAASKSYHTLSEEIKTAERRMAEIAVMEKQIVNYARTRDTYVAYRKAGYSKKFLEAHESDIAIHKAAKQYFDEQGLKKLPTLKSLKAEYAVLMAKKKTAYADYRQSREEMKELLTAKANVDRILGVEPTVPEKEKGKQTDAR